MDTRDSEANNEEEEERKSITDETPSAKAEKGAHNHDPPHPQESEWESQSQTQSPSINSSRSSDLPTRTSSPSQGTEEPTSVHFPTREARPYFLQLNTLVEIPTSFLQPPSPYSPIKPRSPQPYTKILNEKHTMSPTPPATSSPPQEAEQCNICLEALTNPSTVQPCGHRYHYACIENWLRTQYSERGRSRLSCPLCRGVVEGIRTFNPDRVISITYIFEHEREGSRGPPSPTGSDGSMTRGVSREEQRRRSLALMRDGSRGPPGGWERGGSEAPGEYESEREYDSDENERHHEYVIGMDGDLVEWRDRRGEQREREYRNRREHNRRREGSRMPSTYGNRTRNNEAMLQLERNAGRARSMLARWERVQGLVRSRQQDRDGTEREYNAALRERVLAIEGLRIAVGMGREEENNALEYMRVNNSDVMQTQRQLMNAEEDLREAVVEMERTRGILNRFDVNWVTPQDGGPLPLGFSEIEEGLERVRREPTFNRRLLEAPQRGGFLEEGVSYDNRRRPSRSPSRTNPGYYRRTPSPSSPQGRDNSERERSRSRAPQYNRNAERPRSQSRAPQVSPTQRQDSRDQDIHQQTRDHWSNTSFGQQRGAQESATSTSTSRAGPSRTYSNGNGEGSSSGSSSRRTGNRDDHHSGVPEQWLEEDRLARLNLNVTKY